MHANTTYAHVGIVLRRVLERQRAELRDSRQARLRTGQQSRASSIGAESSKYCTG